MAATSTNKQPLLVDHVLHVFANLDTATNDGQDITGTNTATLLIDSTTADGCVVEDVYTMSRSTIPYKVNLYISSARDYLRPNESFYVGTLQSATTKGDVVHWEEMPRVLAPIPRVGEDRFNRAFYLPKGKALWAARDAVANVTDGPLLGIQGGWY